MARVKFAGHGGNVYAAARELSTAPRHLLDFSASINPLGPSPRALRAFLASADTLAHYPDPDCWELRKALSAHWRRPAEMMLVGNGSTELIHVLPTALAWRHLLLVGPTFSEYAAAMARHGGRVTMVQAERRTGYRPPVEQILTALQRGARSMKGARPDAVLLCNPNSPTGQALTAAEVRTIAQAADRLGLWCVVDETFADYCDAVSLVQGRLPKRTILLRSLTKFYGLPGLRIGYMIAAPDLVRRMRTYQAPWSINMPAQCAAVAALRDHRHAARSLRYLERERTRVMRCLAAYADVTVFPSAANFLLLELPRGLSASTLVAALRRQRILIRDCAQVPGLNARSIRIAVRTKAENDRLLAQLSKHLQAARA